MEESDEKYSRIHHLENENLSLRLRIAALEELLRTQQKAEEESQGSEKLSVPIPVAQNDDVLSEMGVRSTSPPAPAAKKRRVTVVPEVVIDANRIKQIKQTARIKREQEQALTDNNTAANQQSQDIVKVKTEAEMDEILSRLLPDEKKVKIEEKVPLLSLDTIRERLKIINYSVYVIDIDEAVRNVTVPRRFISDYWGGNPQDTFPTIKPSRVKIHGLNDFMFLNLTLNPYAPKIPGDSGFFFNAGLSGDDESQSTMETPYRLFIRLSSNKWLYMGQYHMIPSPPLSIDEWRMQSNVTKRTWTDKMAAKDWGRWARTAVGLWERLNRRPTEEELETEMSSENKYSHITGDDLIRGFDEGKLIIFTWCLKCVAYNVGFQETIARELATWVPPPAKKKAARKKAARRLTNKASGKTALSLKKSNVGRKRKREESVESSLSSESELSDSEDEVSEIEPRKRGLDPQYIPKGTRSRPHAGKIRDVSVEL